MALNSLIFQHTLVEFSRRCMHTNFSILLIKNTAITAVCLTADDRVNPTAVRIQSYSLLWKIMPFFNIFTDI